MPSNPKRIGVHAPVERWALLGKLLARQRRVGLGYQSQVKFAAERLPPTPAGNANIRMVRGLENNYRPNTYPEPTLQAIAAWYEVGYESMLAVLRDDADVLGPPSAADAPIAGRDRQAADREYALAIFERLAGLGPDPSGGQVFPDCPGDAKIWDGIGARLPVRDRVWLIADLQRTAAGRNSRPRAG
jgi:hypothetical protein